MTKILLPLLAACLLASPNAWAFKRVFELVERSYELTLDTVTLPDSTAGTVIFRECDTCDPKSLRVTSATRYFLDGTELAFADFKQMVEALRADDDTIKGVYVHYDIETTNVTRIRVVQYPRLAAQ
ncbi:MAG TPA: hypothetical protein VF329_03290 [Gammaproteobacteria bacterium]